MEHEVTPGSQQSCAHHRKRVLGILQATIGQGRSD